MSDPALVAEATDRLSGLRAARDRLAAVIDDVDDPFALVQVIGQYRAVLGDIATLEATASRQAGGTGPTNEVAARAAARKNRQSKAKTKRPA